MKTVPGQENGNPPGGEEEHVGEVIVDSDNEINERAETEVISSRKITRYNRTSQDLSAETSSRGDYPSHCG